MNSTGDDPLSRFVNVLISIKPLYAAMKAGARVVLKNSAEKAGVPWERAERALARQPVAAELEALRAALANPRVVYPDYYTQPFHAYDEGNLCWLAAREIEAATASMAIRTFRNSGDPRLADPAAAQAKLREGIHSRIREYCSGEGEERNTSSASSSSSSSSSGPLIQDILDIGEFVRFLLFVFFFPPRGRSFRKLGKKNSHLFFSFSLCLSLSLFLSLPPILSQAAPPASPLGTSLPSSPRPK